MVSEGPFGVFIRRKREEKELGLREMARIIGVSPTYLSKCERDEFPPPTEDKVRKIADVISCDIDDLLAKAGRVSTDILDIIKRHPVELTALLRAVRDMSTDDITRLVSEAEKMKSDNSLTGRRG